MSQTALQTPVVHGRLSNASTFLMSCTRPSPTPRYTASAQLTFQVRESEDLFVSGNERETAKGAGLAVQGSEQLTSRVSQVHSLLAPRGASLHCAIQSHLQRSNYKSWDVVGSVFVPVPNFAQHHRRLLCLFVNACMHACVCVCVYGRAPEFPVLRRHREGARHTCPQSPPWFRV